MQLLSGKSLEIRVISHNIRYAANPTSKGEAQWKERLPDLLAQFRYHTRYAPDTLICLQEVLDGQLHDLLDGLNKDNNEWASIGVGRDDGDRQGEYVPILFRPAFWHLDHYTYFWLSQTPDRPSLGWDAGCKRVVTVGTFRHKGTCRSVIAMNTHLDNAGSIAREKGAKLIVDRINSYTKVDGSGQSDPLPVVLTGDMNSHEDQEAYKVFTSAESPLQDVRRLTASDRLYGHRNTYTGFNGNGDGEGLSLIDYVFCTNDWEPHGYAILPNIFEDASGKYLSDHRAVVADLKSLNPQGT